MNMKLNNGILKRISIIIIAGVMSISTMACDKKSTNDSEKKKAVVIGLDDTYNFRHLKAFGKGRFKRS